MSTDTAPLVVGVDGSERSRDALALAARLADAARDVLLVHVHPYGRLSTLVPGGDYEDLVRSVAESTLVAVQETLDPDTPRELRLVSDASPAAGVQSIAEKVGASMIVVGSSHRSGLGRVFAGSVAESMLTGAPVPVAIAPHGYATRNARVEIIGCGFDGSPESHEALAWADAFARARSARLRALAVHTRIAFGGLPISGAIGFESANDALRAALEQQLREALDSLADDRDVDARLLEGDAAAELAAASADLDLLVIGSRGYGPVRSVLLGRVSRALVRSAACPVVVLPRGATGTPASASRPLKEDTVRPTEPFRREHEQLLEHIEHLAQAAREMPRLSEDERAALRARVLGFLRDTLVPHARAEEEILYPEWAALVGFADAAVPMVHDHEAIVARIQRLEVLDVGDLDALQELLYGLYALISVHFRKEEDLQLPAFDAAPEVAARVLARMGDAAGHAHTH